MNAFHENVPAVGGQMDVPDWPGWDAERRARQLPRTPRPYEHEDLDCYFRRLMKVNFLPLTSLPSAARGVEKSHPDQAHRSRSLVLELMAGLPVGYLELPARRPLPGCLDDKCACAAALSKDRFRCVACSKGEFIKQRPHLDVFVCRKHHRWVGPGVDTHPQILLVGMQAYDAAARKQRKLMNAGKLDLRRFRQIWDVITRASAEHLWAPDYAAPRNADDRQLGHAVIAYPASLMVYETLEDSRVLTRVLNPGHSADSMERELAEVLTKHLGAGQLGSLARLLRYHLRADLYRVALATTPGWHQGRSCIYPIPKQEAHDRDLGGIDYESWPPLRAGIAPTFPGFDHSDSPLYVRPEDRGSASVFFWSSPSGKLPGDEGTSSVDTSWICSAGHTFHRVLWRRRPWAGCVQCSGRAAVPGVTDFATTNPDAFAFWDHSRNDGTRYWEVKAGSGFCADWICPNGHTWQQNVIEFAGRARCVKMFHSEVASSELGSRVPPAVLDVGLYEKLAP